MASAILTHVPAIMPAAFPGMSPGLGGHDFIESLINGMFATAQVTGHTFTSADSTTFTITVAGHAVSITTPASGNTPSTIRDQFLAAFAADAYVYPLVEPSASGATLRLTELRPEDGNVVVSSGAGIAQATVTAHGDDTGIQPGVLVANGTAIANATIDGRSCRLLQTGDVLASIAGAVESRFASPQDDLYGRTSRAQYKPGNSVNVKRQGSIWLISETTFTRGQAPFVRIIASGVNTNIGAVRNAADGGNTVALTAGYFASGTNAVYEDLLLAEFQLNLPS